MYKKILWWAKNHPDKPLSYPLLVACIFHEKCDPEEYYNDSLYCDKNEFIRDCKKSNAYTGNESGIEIEFKSNTGLELNDIISSEIWQQIITMNSLNDFFENKTFDSQNEIKTLCKKIYNDYLNEPCFLDDKKLAKNYGQRGIAYSMQMKNLSRTVGAADKWAEGTANTYWFGINAIRCIDKRVKALLECEQTEELYKKSVIDLKEYFNFSNLQVEMLKYFFCQSIEGTCPPHRNKAVFIWGDNKGVGKTTIASTIVAILNGEKNINNTRMYESDLAQELGWKDHTAPMICSCRAVLMDEAMPKDSSKSYGTFKKRITTDGCKIRFVYQNQIDVPAKANYVFTSNDPLDVFVQDKTERRFLEFHIEKKHNNLSYEKIYDIFLNFARQCKRESNWLEWSDSLAKETEVRGIESKNIEDIISYFETPSFADEINLGASQVSIGTFYQHVFRFDKNATKETIRACIIKMFGEPCKPSTWKKSDVLAILKGAKKEDLTDDEELPF